jgi:predicted alpha-1,2-mannosidase
LLLLSPLSNAAKAQKAALPVELVDPFIGTEGTGHTFPGPSRPFGMVQPGPDNAESGWEFTSGYQYRAPIILGFSQTRASGTGCNELGDILLQPLAERRESDFGSDYDKSSEVARPGYYAVTLQRNSARVELTSTVRVAMHRYTFAHPGRVYLLADFQHGLMMFGAAQPRVTASDIHPGRDGIEGTVRSVNWAKRTVAFTLRFDHPIAESVVLPAAKGELAPRYLLAFELGKAKVLQAKVALSTTDVEGARRNLSEAPGWNFDGVVQDSRREWERLLGRVELSAPEAQQRIFYTALYHVFLHPSVISDVDGRYRGLDGKITTSGHRLHYSTLSLWDTFRAALPLDALLVPERVNDFVESILDDGDQQGYLPLWPIWDGETNTMLGNPSLPVIAMAWADGFRGFDGKRALAAMVKSSTVDHKLSDWTMLDQYGYLPLDKVENEAVSRTLEAGIGDAATANMAAMLGEKEVEMRFAKRAQNWRLLMDPDTHLARGRNSRGEWRTPFDPITPTSPLNNPGDYTEANAWQYTFAPALHNADGLVEAMGGREGFTTMLDRFFALPGLNINKYLGQEALIGQYAHGNEPSHHIAWLYALSSTPCRGQQMVRRIASSFYHATPDGIIGNEDAGQMSAWYVFATLGFYPVEPAQGQYVLGAPMAERISIKVPGRKLLVIEAPGAAGDNFCAATFALNRTAVEGTRIDHLRLISGGRLTFTAKSTP